MSEKNKTITARVTQAQYQKLLSYSIKRGRDHSDIIREFIDKLDTMETLKNEIKLIKENIGEKKDIIKIKQKRLKDLEKKAKEKNIPLTRKEKNRKMFKQMKEKGEWTE